MGMGMELLAGYTTAPGATITALTMAAGNSLTIRNTPTEARIMLLDTWTQSQAAGTLRIRSPKLHDNVQGIRFATVVSEVQPLLPEHFNQRLYPQDTLIFELSGSAVAGDIESACMLVFYEDLQGIEGRFLSEAQVVDRMVNVVTVENTLTLGAGGGYTGEEALDAEFDLLKANTDYALLGYQASAECAAVRWRGPDFGNLGLGGPGTDSDKHLTRSWFLHLASRYQMPLIPVLNSANKSGTFLDGVQDENATAVTVSTILAELRAA